MKFGRKLRRAESSFSSIVGLELPFVSYKSLKKLLKQTVAFYNKWQQLRENIMTNPEEVTATENQYLESAERFMGILCQDVLEISWTYDSQIKTAEIEKQCYLQAYAFLNTEAVRKICKKFDKHVQGENILDGMMKKLQAQSFYADIQSLGLPEIEALREVLEGEGFNGEDETIPFMLRKLREYSEAHTEKKQQTTSTTGHQVVKEQLSPGNYVAETHTMQSAMFLPSPHATIPSHLYNNFSRSISPQYSMNGSSPRTLLNQSLPSISYGMSPQSMTYPWNYTEHLETPRSENMSAISQQSNQSSGVFTPKTSPLAHRESHSRRSPQQSRENSTCRSDGTCESVEDAGNLIINFLPNEWSEVELLNLFSVYGEIVSARVIRERYSRKSKGYGFVKFTSDSFAQKAIEAVNGQWVGQKRLKVAFARPRKSRHLANLFVSRFPPDWTSVALRKIFEPYGNIIDCRVLRGADGESKRCGFVRFGEEEDAMEAIIALNGHVISDTNRLRVKVADRERYQQMKALRSRWDYLHSSAV